MGLTVLDASILIAVLDATDAHHERAAAALRQRVHQRDRVVLPVSSYAEALVGPYRRGPEAVGAVDAFLAALPCDIEAASRPIARRAAELRSHVGRGLRLPDAFVIATALELSADSILTADRGWPAIPGVTVEMV